MLSGHPKYLSTSHWICGHSALEADDDWLYVGFRTSSQVMRFPLAEDGQLGAETLSAADVEWIVSDPVFRCCRNSAISCSASSPPPRFGVH